jgi:ribonucleoside-diphosphate reductase alpha chain
VGSLSLKDESINTWKVGVERALKKYVPGNTDDEEEVNNES